MMRLLFFFPLVPTLLFAQSDFLKNPDIVWAAEIEQDWVVDLPLTESTEEMGIGTLKLYSKELHRIHSFPPTLFQLVCLDASSGKMEIFKDATCTIPVKWSELFPNVNRSYFDPDENLEFIRLYDRKFDLESVRVWRLRQILIYHKKSATWSTFVKSIAPLTEIEKGQSDSVGRTPMFWFRPDNKRQKLNNKDIVWAKEMTNKQKKAQIPTYPKQMVKVTNGFQNPLVHLFDVLKSNLKTEFYNAWNKAPLSPEERTTALTPLDGMVVVFDPTTYEEQVVTARGTLDPFSIHRLQLVQTWYWDAHHSRLSICLDAVAPLVDFYYSSGTQKVARPLFYRRAKK